MQPGRHAEPPLVFVVEDNSDDEALTIRALKKMEPLCDVLVARDGQEAVDALRAPMSRIPDLILLDIKLPKLNGIEVLRTIRGNPSMKGVPAIMLTSSDEPSDLVNSYQTGASGFVRKPVAYEEYVDAVKTLSKFWLQINLRPVAIKNG